MHSFTSTAFTFLCTRLVEGGRAAIWSEPNMSPLAACYLHQACQGSHATWRTRQKHCARRKTSPHLPNIGASLEDIAAGAIGTIFQSTVDNEAKHFNYYDPQKKDKHYIVPTMKVFDRNMILVDFSHSGLSLITF